MNVESLNLQSITCSFVVNIAEFSAILEWLWISGVVVFGLSFRLRLQEWIWDYLISLFQIHCIFWLKIRTNDLESFCIGWAYYFVSISNSFPILDIRNTYFFIKNSPTDPSPLILTQSFVLLETIISLLLILKVWVKYKPSIW